MITTASWLSGLIIGPAQAIGELTLAPLIHERPAPVGDMLVEEAIEKGQLQVVELDEGVVQQVLARNHGPTDVLVLEGDTLIGSKQNRMVAWSVLVGAGTTIPVSVGCMERGRWSRGGPGFKMGAMSVDPHIRRRSKRETSATAGAPHGPQLDQQRAWSDVDRKLREWTVPSASADYHAGLLARAGETRARLGKLNPSPGEVGVIALHNGRLLGLESVAHPETWRRLARRVLPAYALGAESARFDPEFERVGQGSPGEWLKALLRADRKKRRAPGKGTHLVISGSEIAGSCLWHEGSVRHLTVFAK